MTLVPLANPLICPCLQHLTLKVPLKLQVQPAGGKYWKQWLWEIWESG